MSQDLNLVLRITGDGSGVRGELRTITGETVKFADQLEGGSRRGTRALRQTEQQTNRLSRSTQQLTRRVAAIAAGYISLQGASRLMRTITDNTIEQERVWAQLEAGIEATGGAAGRTLAQMQNLSTQYQATTTVANESVEQVMSQLLAFRNISEGVFDRTTGLVLDFAQTTGRDATQAVRTLGVAINDPLAGMARLSQAGISLSQDFQQMVRELVEMGEMSQAQNLLLDELEKSFGGAAVAARNTFGGALQALRNDFDDLLKYTGDMPALAGQIEAIGARLRDPELLAAVEDGIGAALGLIPPAIDAGVTAIEILVPLLVTTAEHADKIGVAAQALAVILTGRLVAALTATTKAKVLALASTQRYGAALIGLAMMSRTAAAGQLALAAATTTANAALALVGGPIGAVALAIGGAALASRAYARDLDSLADFSDESTAAIERLSQITSEDWDHRPIQAYRADLKVLRDELEDTIERMDEMQSGPQLERRDRTAPMGGGSHGRELSALEQRRDALEEQIELEHELIRVREHQTGVAHYEDVATGLELFGAAGEAAIGLMERLGLVQRDNAAGAREMAAASSDITDPLERMVEQLEQQWHVLHATADGYTSAAMALLEYQEQQALSAARDQDAKDSTDANVAAVRAHFTELRRLTSQIEAKTAADEQAAAAQQALKARADAMVQSYRQLFAQMNPVGAEYQRLTELLAEANDESEEWTQALEEAGFTASQSAQFIALINQAIDDLDVDGTAALSDELEELRRAADPAYESAQLLTEEMELLQQLSDAGLIDDAEFEQLSEWLQQAYGDAMDLAGAFEIMAGAAGATLRAVQQFAGRGSKEFEALEIAINAVALVQGISAVLNQGQGDPYSAPVRMAMMAAAIAPLIANLAGSIGNFGGGGFSNTAEQRQETQGTGSVLGDPEAKSESMLNAMEIVANATSTLVGINRGMLRALLSMQRGIEGASGMLARGAGQVDFSGMGLSAAGSFNDLLDPIGLTGGLGNFFADPLSILGGSSKVTDEGILIVGDTFEQLINQVMAGAYQEVQSKSWKFGRTRTREGFAELDDGLLDQFSLIFESIADTVLEGAVALGLSRDEVERAIAEYEIENVRISLMGLTAEEQQDELAAVFSQIFDGLAGHIVPFISQFQQVGEGMGEALVRVATGVQVTQEAVSRLGFALDEADPERFAQISEALIELTGGLDEYMSGVVGFFDRFADDATKLAVAQDDLTRAFDQYGIVLPDTRQGMWELMQTLDATTESGREQIAILLELREVSDAYYKGLEAIENERAGLERRILQIQGDTVALRQLELDKLDESNRALQLRVWALEDEAELADMMLDVTNELTRLNAGPLVAEFQNLQRGFDQSIARAQALGASEEELWQIRELHDARLMQLADRLRDSIRSTLEVLFGSGDGSVGSAFGGDFSSSIEDAANRVRDSLIRALEGVDEWLRRSAFEDPSMTGTERFGAMEDEFERLMQIALHGEGQEQADAMAMLPQLASQLEQMGVQMYGSGTPEFQAFREALIGQMESLLGVEVPEEQQPPTGAQVGAIQNAVEQMVLTAAEQQQLAGQLIQELGALASITGQSPIDIIEGMGYPLKDVIEMLIGDVNEQTVGVVNQLIAVGQALGMSLGEVAAVIGLQVGSLRDATSLMSQALETEIDMLPDELKDQLGPLLEALREATTEADANEILEQIEDVVGDMPPKYQNKLAPFFEGIDPTSDLEHQTDLMTELNRIQGDQLTVMRTVRDTLEKVRQNLAVGNQSEGVPGFAKGGWASGIIRTGEVGPELVLPHDVSTFLQREGLPVRVGGGTDPHVRQYLGELVQQGARAAEQRERLGEQQVQVVSHLSGAMMEAERRRASERGMSA